MLNYAMGHEISAELRRRAAGERLARTVARNNRRGHRDQRDQRREAEQPSADRFGAAA